MLAKCQDIHVFSWDTSLHKDFFRGDRGTVRKLPPKTLSRMGHESYRNGNLKVLGLFLDNEYSEVLWMPHAWDKPSKCHLIYFYKVFVNVLDHLLKYNGFSSKTYLKSLYSLQVYLYVQYLGFFCSLDHVNCLNCSSRIALFFLDIPRFFSLWDILASKRFEIFN